MNPVEKAIRKLDATQQRYTPTAFVFGVIKKYGDDNGGVLASNLAYSAFVSIFPLLLILTTILGLVASVNPSVRTQVLNAVAGPGPADRQDPDRQRAPAPALEHHRADHRLRRPDLGGHRPGPGRPVHDGAGLEPARPRPARVRPAAGTRDALHRPARRRRDRHDRAGQPQHLRAQGLLGGDPGRGAGGGLQRRDVRRRLPRADPEGRADPQAAARRDHRRHLAGRCCRSSAPGWCITSCTATRSTACSAPCSACWPGSTSRCRSPCTAPRSTWCWPGGCGRGPSSSRR